MTLPRRDELHRLLPYARRYARALTGEQSRGDDVVAESVRVLLDMPPSDGDLRVQLYKAITHQLTPYAANAVDSSSLTLLQRQILLLTSLEDMPLTAAAETVSVSVDHAAEQLSLAREQVRKTAATDVLIIEDEPLIAMDMEELILSCGHRVVGVAASEIEAVEVAGRYPPGLILADINLGAGGSGNSAVQRIIQRHHVPVIFVTAFPERLLTGETLEPTFMIAKPFEPLTLATATFQAVTGGIRLDKR